MKNNIPTQNNKFYLKKIFYKNEIEKMILEKKISIRKRRWI